MYLSSDYCYYEINGESHHYDHFYDLVAIIIVGTIASEPLISTEFRPTLYALVILTALHILFSKLTLHQLINRLFLGEPTLLIKDGEILEDNLEKSKLSVTQLLSISKKQKVLPQIADVDYAMLEPIGEVSVVPKSGEYTCNGSTFRNFD